MTAIIDLANTVRDKMKGLASAGLFSLWLEGKPIPTPRPRLTKWGVYYPKTYMDWLKANALTVQDMDSVPTDKPIALTIEVICQRPKSTDKATPLGDVDNFAKGPMDLITKHGKAWADDRQVVWLSVFKRWASEDEEPGFLLHWCEVNDYHAELRKDA